MRWLSGNQSGVQQSTRLTAPTAPVAASTPGSSKSTVLAMRYCRTSSAVACGYALQMSAATPAICGAAAEVPKKEILPAGLSGDRNLSSVILYLLTAKTVSLMHRLKYDEMFHFYLGNPVTMLQLHPDGSSEIITLGHDILSEQEVQVLVPKGTWQGAFIQPGGKFSLMVAFGAIWRNGSNRFCISISRLS